MATTSMSRRAFLRRLGIGAGAVTVVAAGGLTWRIADQGVLAPGSGPAYDAWRARLTGEGPRSLVRAAILAANAHDTQPWRFRITSTDRIDLFADRTRTIGAVDPLGRELEISLGCALENLALAAPASGYEPRATVLPDASQPDHVARIDLGAAPATSSPLFEAIPLRHTDRSAYDTTRTVERAVLDELAALADDPAAAIVWLDAGPEKARFAELTVQATRVLTADPDQSRDDFAWYRQDWAEIQRRKDGITMDTAGLSDLFRVVVRLLPPSDRATLQQGWVDATRDRHVATAAAFGLIGVQDGAVLSQRVAAGRLFQRIHLAATLRGLAIQPLNQVFERVDRETAAGLEPTFGAAMAELTPAGQVVVMAFRIGHPIATPNLSPRRPAEDVIAPS
jgi:nitroreductase